MNEKARNLFESDKNKRFRHFVQVKNALMYSPAWKTLNGHAVKVYLWSLMKFRHEKKKDIRIREKAGIPNPKQPPFSFTFNEAECFGLSRKQFASALRQLVGVGIFDVSRKGSGRHGDYSLYTWSDRWKKFATPDFVHIPYPENKRHLPRGKDGRWESSKPTWQIFRNRAEKRPYQTVEVEADGGNKLPLSPRNKGQKMPLDKGRKMPLKISCKERRD